MAVSRPTLEKIIERIIGDIDTTNPELYASIPETPMNVFATASGGIVHGVYGYTDFLFKMALPTEGGATGTYLAKWGSLYGVDQRTATAARPTVRFVATGAGVLPSGLMLRRVDGALYEILEETAFAFGDNDVVFVAVQTGEASSIDDQTVLTMTESVVNIALTGVVQGDADGEDIESESAWSARIRAKMQSEASGGNKADFIRWATDVPGVGSAWLVSTLSPYVDIRITSNDPSDLEPSVELIAAVQAVMDEKKPVPSIPIVSAPVITLRNITLTSLTPNNAATHSAVNAALRAFFDLPAFREAAATIYRTQIDAVIQGAAGVVTFTRTVPASDIVNDPDEISDLGTVSLPAIP